MHHSRLLRHGDVDHRDRLRGEGLEARFWQKVDICGPDECWLWTAATYSFGYGNIRRDDGRNDGAHRVSWEIHNGPIPDGFWVLHHCDNPPCCNPAHLYLGDRTDNVRDMHRRSRNFAYGPNENPQSKLTEDDVRSIRAAFTGTRGEKAALARQYGVSKPTIQSVLSRNTWAWLK